MTIAARTAALEATIAKVAGVPVSLTIRGERDFTVSTDEVCLDLLARVGGFFGHHATATVDHDDECGSFVYITVH
jgi:hypothetical protein